MRATVTHDEGCEQWLHQSISTWRTSFCAIQGDDHSVAATAGKLNIVAVGITDQHLVVISQGNPVHVQAGDGDPLR